MALIKEVIILQQNWNLITTVIRKGWNSMIYTCEDCSFLFYRVGEAKQCPSCDQNHIRCASQEEIQRLQKLLELEKLTLLKEK